jgi:hypothetical protein
LRNENDNDLMASLRGYGNYATSRAAPALPGVMEEPRRPDPIKPARGHDMSES